jgi:DNA-binding transcriptional regulator YiaG
MIHRARFSIFQKPYQLRGEEFRFLRKHIDLNHEEFARLLRVNKTTLSKWENNEAPLDCRATSWPELS